MTTHKWQFVARFRRHAFGWRSDTPIQRIKEAVSEIKQVARKEPVVAAEGAVTLLEKLSPALEQVDSSSGALGTAVNRAIDTLVPIIAKPDVDQRVRQRWLERLWDAVQNDEIPYIELLGDYWASCARPRNWRLPGRMSFYRWLNMSGARKRPVTASSRERAPASPPCMQRVGMSSC